MELDIAPGIQKKGIEVAFELVEIWGSDHWNGDEVAYVKPVRVNGTYMITDDTVVVNAEAATVIQAPCARCLQPADISVRGEIEEAFLRDREDREWSIADEEYHYKGHIIKLNDVVRVSLLQELPTRILCKEECKGLCPVCGTDLNQSTCSCQKEIGSRNPFSALASMLNEDEEV